MKHSMKMSLKHSLKVSLKNLENSDILVASNRYDGETEEHAQRITPRGLVTVGEIAPRHSTGYLFHFREVTKMVNSEC